jgi:integrase
MNRGRPAVPRLHCQRPKAGRPRLQHPRRNGALRKKRLRAWHAFSERVLGRRLSFHALRHSAATLMLGQGVGLRTVSDVLGHANIRITSDTYVEVLDNLKVDAARHMDDLFSS